MLWVQSDKQGGTGVHVCQDVQNITGGGNGTNTSSSLHGITSDFPIILSSMTDRSVQLYHAVIRMILIG